MLYQKNKFDKYSRYKTPLGQAIKRQNPQNKQKRFDTCLKGQQK